MGLLQQPADEPGFTTATIGLDEQFYCSGVLVSDCLVEGVPSLPHMVPLITDEVYLVLLIVC